MRVPGEFCRLATFVADRRFGDRMAMIGRKALAGNDLGVALAYVLSRQNGAEDFGSNSVAWGFLSSVAFCRETRFWRQKS